VGLALLLVRRRNPDATPTADARDDPEEALPGRSPALS
jgi:hypothetical protein